MLPYVRRRIGLIPLNVVQNGQELSWQCLIFALTKSKHCQLTTHLIRLMGLIVTYLYKSVNEWFVYACGSVLRSNWVVPEYGRTMAFWVECGGTTSFPQNVVGLWHSLKMW